MKAVPVWPEGKELRAWEHSECGGRHGQQYRLVEEVVVPLVAAGVEQIWGGGGEILEVVVDGGLVLAMVREVLLRLLAPVHQEGGAHEERCHGEGCRRHHEFCHREFTAAAVCGGAVGIGADNELGVAVYVVGGGFLPVDNQHCIRAGYGRLRHQEHGRVGLFLRPGAGRRRHKQYEGE